MRRTQRAITVWSIAISAIAATASGQQDLERTITVDLSGHADETSIQDAIDEADPTAGRWTILIYAGEYDLSAPLTLNEADENIDLVGVDRDAVIINVSGTGKSGIVITSGTETERRNAIRNLTIVTEDGHGIEIVKGETPVPAGIVIEGVTVLAHGTSKYGLSAPEINDLVIERSDISSDAFIGVGLGQTGSGGPFCDGVALRSSTFRGSGATSQALSVSGGDNIVAEACVFTGASTGVKLLSVTSLDLAGGRLHGEHVGLDVGGVSDFLSLRDCTIVAEKTTDDGATARAVRYDWGGVTAEQGLLLLGCKVTSTSTTDDGAIGIWPDVGPLTAIGCEIVARSLHETAGGLAHGVHFEVGNATAVLMNCTISTSAVDEKEADVFDIVPFNDVITASVSRTSFSKWNGPILAAGGTQVSVQRMLDVDAADDDFIMSETPLTGSEQRISASLNSPDVYRALEVNGVGDWDDDFDVYIVGTDWADNAITAKITVDVAGGGETDPSAMGNKPFKTVTTIILPRAELGQTQAVKIGTTDKLGLYRPIAAEDDVFQWATIASDAWKIESGSITVDDEYATVDPGAITTGDGFEFTFLTP